MAELQLLGAGVHLGGPLVRLAWVPRWPRAGCAWGESSQSGVLKLAGAVAVQESAVQLVHDG